MYYIDTQLTNTIVGKYLDKNLIQMNKKLSR